MGWWERSVIGGVIIAWAFVLKEPANNLLSKLWAKRDHESNKVQAEPLNSKNP